MTAIRNPEAVPFEGAASFGADALERHGARGREVANADACQLAQRLETEGRDPTSDERHVLLAYSGVGGTTSSGSDHADGNTLGLLNEYYTPIKVARAVWRLVESLGFTGGQALEPAAGTGVFLETAPEAIRFTAVELNPDAARINRLLHLRAEVRSLSFEADSHHSDELEFDLVIGNPPFGPRGLNALEGKPQWKSYAPYFVDAALDRLRDGGLLAFVLPSGLVTSDQHLGFRAHVLARARLRALMRLPVSTFASSGARAATDVIVLEKRPWVVGDTLAELIGRFGLRALASAAVLDAAARDFLQGRFYDSRPECVLGEMVRDARWGGLVCDGVLDAPTLERLANAPLLESPRGASSLGRLLKLLEASGAFTVLARAKNTDVRGALESAWSSARAKGYPHREGLERSDGRVFKLVMDSGRWTRGWREVQTALHPAIESALEVAGKLQAFHEARGLRGDELEAQRIAALEALQAHVAAHGNPHASLLLTAAARVKPTLYRLLGALRSDGRIAPVLLEPRCLPLERSPNLETVCERLDRTQRLTIKALLEAWEGGTRSAARAALIESDAWMVTPEIGRAHV